MKERYHFLTNENGEEAIPIWDWNKNHKLKIFIETQRGDIKIASLRYNKKADIYYFPQIEAKAYLSIDHNKQTQVFAKDFEDHNYISFHASGIVKGPDYKEKNDGYSSFDFRIDNLDKPRELFELFPTHPESYPLYNKETDHKKSLSCFLKSPSDMKKCTPRLIFDIVDTEHFKSSEIFKWERKYIAAYEMINLEKENNIILLIALSFLESDIPKHENVKINLLKSPGE